MASGSGDKPVTPADDGQAERLHRFSHGIKNRLAGLQEVARMLGTPDAKEQEGELRDFFEQQFFRSLQEVESLMDDLSVPRGPQELHLAPVAIGPLVQEAVADVQHRIERKQQNISVGSMPGIEVLAEAHYLQQALQALLSNASKFSPASSSIAVNVSQDQGHCSIVVRDQGVGLSQEDLEKVFDRYALLGSRSTAGEAQGRSTLARVQQWIKAMQGTITARSEGPGKGSSFTIRIPLS